MSGLKIIIYLIIVSICLGCNRTTNKDQSVGKIDASRELMNLNGMEIGFAYGIKSARCALLFSERQNIAGGIRYDPTALAECLRNIYLNEQEIIKFSEKPDELLFDPNPSTAAKSLDDLLKILSDILIFKGKKELTQAIKMGFIIGYINETISISLAHNIEDVEIYYLSKLTPKTWEPVFALLEQVELPKEIETKIKQINPNVKSVDDLKKFHAGCYDVWKTINERTQPHFEKISRLRDYSVPTFYLTESFSIC